MAPPSEPPKLSAKERKATVEQLGARFTAEARSHGIPLEDLIQHLIERKSHV